MIHVQNFIDKVSLLESKKNKDLVLPVQEARGLRDEIAKLLVEIVSLKSQVSTIQEVIKVELKGTSFK